MAEALTLAGLPVRVRKNTWRELPSLYQGGRQRMRLNNLISTEDATTRKRVAECELYFLTAAEESAARAAAMVGEGIAIAGELPGTGFTAVVDVGQTTAIKTIDSTGQTLHRIAAIRLEEV